MEVIDITHEGLGVCKKDGLVYFVKDAIYGETITVKDIVKKKRVVYCKKDKVIKESPYIVNNNDIIRNVNPAAPLKDLEYIPQLKLKERNVKNIFRKIGKVSDFKIHKVVSASHFGKESIYNYRNKTRFKVQDGVIGYFKPGTNEIVEISNCILSSILINDTLRLIKTLFTIKELLNVREITIKSNVKNEVFIEFEVYANDEKSIQNISNKLTESLEYKNLEEEGKLKLHTIVFRKEGVVIYEQKRSFGAFLRKIGKYYFKVSPNSFFQVNSNMNEALYNEILETVKIVTNNTENSMRLLELYSGVGSIGIYCGKYFESITGVEIVKDATENSIYNVGLNGENKNKYNFVTSKSEEIDERYYTKCDVVLLDPPRAGLEKNIIENIVRNDIKDVIYVSCDPATLARDVKEFIANGYTLKEYKLVDMFPNTMHVESVVLLSKK